MAAVDSADTSAAEAAVEQLTGGAGLSAAIVCAGAPAAFEAAIQHAGFGGTIVAVGIPHAAVPVSILAFVKKRLRLQGTQSGSPADIRQMMALVARVGMQVVPPVELHPFDAVPDLMEKLAAGQLMHKVGVHVCESRA